MCIRPSRACIREVPGRGVVVPAPPTHLGLGDDEGAC